MLAGLGLKFNRAQSAAELAIFGSVVLFIIGMILRQAFTANQESNTQLHAARMALQESYLTANGKYSDRFSAGRNTASFMVIEDRLAIDPGAKHGSQDRFPTVMQSSGTMTHAMMMDIDLQDVDDQGVFDFVINGQRFPLLTGKVVEHTLCYDGGGAICPSGSIKVPRCVVGGPGGAHPEQKPTEVEHRVCYCFDGQGCQSNEFVFFEKVYNGKADEDGNLIWEKSDDGRFDLNLDGISDVPDTANYLGTGSSLRDLFMWQWRQVYKDSFEEGYGIDVDDDAKTEQLLTINANSEEVFGIVPGSPHIIKFRVYDGQAGDIDTTADEETEQRYIKKKESAGLTNVKFIYPGLGEQMGIFSFSTDGTMLQNREGKLYKADGQFVRNETRQDRLDIVERVLNLSNDTGRFCSSGGTGNAPCDGVLTNCKPTNWGRYDWATKQGLYTMINPVEACNDCLSHANNKLTCMETGERPVIFIRSRIRDKRRSVWITRVGAREEK